MLNPSDWIYDLETFPNIFTAAFKHPNTGTRVIFEISDRKNESVQLYEFLNALAAMKCRLVGFNNNGFDYPILHFFINHFHAGITVEVLYEKAQQIINTPWERRFENVVWESETLITQIDLFKVHHFDNDARRTSLKMLEYNMCLPNISDLPFEPGTILDDQQKDVLIVYNWDDVDATESFYIESLDMLEFREELSEKYGRNYLNYNDKKIGTSHLINELERQMPGSCYTYDNGYKQLQQTHRDHIALLEVIFPYVKFKRPEFERVRQELASKVIYHTKGVFEDLSAVLDGFKFDFGTGGIHGSVDPCVVESNEESVIYDWDVASYYPNLGIVNRLFPAHLYETFCDIYREIYEQRKQYKKGTPLNLALKLALNGAYGDSNSKYSPFYDPFYTMSITINGQLLLCMLAEHLMEIPGLKMIQINTDGLTVQCPAQYITHMENVCKWWEEYTCLELESAIYNRMFIRDVNNYIGEYQDGKLKRKGAYAHERIIDNPSTQERQWHQNHSCLIAPKAAEAALVRGEDIETFIRNHDNDFDFMLRTKIKGQDYLLFGEQKQQKVTRFFVSNAPGSGSLLKISPPVKRATVGQWKRKNGITDDFYYMVINELKSQDPKTPDLDSTGLPWDERINTKNRSRYENRTTNIVQGYGVKICNNVKDFNRVELDYGYYINEARKLVEPLKNR